MTTKAMARFLSIKRICVNCNGDSGYFSVYYDEKTDSYAPTWDRFCSMACASSASNSGNHMDTIYELG